MPLFSKPFFEDNWKKWSGNQTLVLSLDVGATHTAVAVALLVKGRKPTIIAISRWPGQEDRIYEEKVPTVVLYDGSGKMVTCGAEALRRQNEDSMEAKYGTLAKNFKLHLHPNAVVQTNSLVLDPLPPDVRLEAVYTDFVKYVLDHTKNHLASDTGRDQWTPSTDIIFILAHPNGWGTHEQEFLRRVVVSASSIESPKIHFVEEAEASARYCISQNARPFASQLKKGSKFVVCDAGGSTVDITTYEIKSMSSDRANLRELGVSSCVASGGLHVDKALREYLTNALAFRYGEEELKYFIRDGMRNFEQYGKRTFKSSEQGISVKVGEWKLNNYPLNITNGEMSIPGNDVQTFFSFCVDAMVDCLTTQAQTPGIEHIVLTGGLGESPHVKNRLQETFKDKYAIVTANSSNSKAVAVGALLFAVGGNVVVDRQKRFYETWLANFTTVLTGGRWGS